jgi:hypothetical protein
MAFVPARLAPLHAQFVACCNDVAGVSKAYIVFLSKIVGFPLSSHACTSEFGVMTTGDVINTLVDIWLVFDIGMPYRNRTGEACHQEFDTKTLPKA